MKKIAQLAFAGMAATFLLSCSTDDSTSELTGEGMVKLEFDNSVSGDDLILGAGSYTNSQGETLKVTRLNYIVSNFRLTDADGTVFTYPKASGYFITNEETGATEIVLENIPAGRYTSLTFGLGVDQEKFLLGAEGQGDLLAAAEANNMMWAWQAGYKFLNFEGTFTSSSVAEPTIYQIHMGSHGSSLDNYKEVTLALPENALVSSTLNPVIHVVTDCGVILDGTNKIALSEGAVIMVNAEKSPKIAVNASGMFSVDHVHNGDGASH